MRVLGQLPKKLAAGRRVLARTESSRTQSGTKQGGSPHDHWAKWGNFGTLEGGGAMNFIEKSAITTNEYWLPATASQSRAGSRHSIHLPAWLERLFPSRSSRGKNKFGASAALISFAPPESLDVSRTPAGGVRGRCSFRRVRGNCRIRRHRRGIADRGPHFCSSCLDAMTGRRSAWTGFGIN